MSPTDVQTIQGDDQVAADSDNFADHLARVFPESFLLQGWLAAGRYDLLSDELVMLSKQRCPTAQERLDRLELVDLLNDLWNARKYAP